MNRYEGTETAHTRREQKGDTNAPHRSSRDLIYTEELRRYLSGRYQRNGGILPWRLLPNFDDKEQIFLAVIDRRRPKALDDIFQQVSEPAERIAMVRDWFSNQWRLKHFIALRMEFSRRAMRDRSVRKHLAELRRQELETYAASVGRYLSATVGVPADRPKIVALVLLAVAHGLGSIAINTDPESEHMYTEAAKLAFDRMSAPPIPY